MYDRPDALMIRPNHTIMLCVDISEAGSSCIDGKKTKCLLFSQVAGIKKAAFAL